MGTVAETDFESLDLQVNRFIAAQAINRQASLFTSDADSAALAGSGLKLLPRDP